MQSGSVAEQILHVSNHNPAGLASLWEVIGAIFELLFTSEFL